MFNTYFCVPEEKYSGEHVLIVHFFEYVSFGDKETKIERLPLKNIHYDEKSINDQDSRHLW